MKPETPLTLIHGTGDDADVVITPEDEARSHADTVQLHDWLMAAWKRDSDAIGEQVIEHLPDGGVYLDELALLIHFEIAVSALRGIAANTANGGDSEAEPSAAQAWLYRKLAAIALTKVLPRERTLVVLPHRTRTGE